MWERGDKTNQGLPELNGSSVGMAKVCTELNASYCRLVFCESLRGLSGGAGGDRWVGPFRGPRGAQVRHPCVAWWSWTLSGSVGFVSTHCVSMVSVDFSPSVCVCVCLPSVHPLLHASESFAFEGDRRRSSLCYFLPCLCCRGCRLGGHHQSWNHKQTTGRSWCF